MNTIVSLLPSPEQVFLFIHHSYTHSSNDQSFCDCSSVHCKLSTPGGGLQFKIRRPASLSWLRGFVWFLIIIPVFLPTVGWAWTIFGPGVLVWGDLMKVTLFINLH